MFCEEPTSLHVSDDWRACEMIIFWLNIIGISFNLDKVITWKSKCIYSMVLIDSYIQKQIYQKRVRFGKQFPYK